jgi:ribosomal protein S18
MAGNVSEWVLDVYRPLTSEDYDEFRPFRGNVFKTKLLNNEGTTETKNAQVEYDVHGMKEYINEFERIRFQRITGDEHKLNDTVIKGLATTVSSRNPVKRGVAPDQYFVSHNKTKDTIELRLLTNANTIIDKAIALKNDKFDQEASMLIQEELFEGLFTEPRTSAAGEEYAYEIVSMLKDGFKQFITDTPGKLKYRNVTEEENIGRLNYRKDDYADYLDGDIESSIYFKNDDRKNAINQASRDPKLVMYQSSNEEFGIDGKPIGTNGNKAHPTTLISDRAHVYKGGSWKDRAYWLAIGNRRYLDEDKSSDAIGFRCAMDRVGSPVGMNSKSNKKKK